MRRLSTYPEIVAYRARTGPRPVDEYRMPDCIVHVVHDEGCQRAQTADGLCTCEDPGTYETQPSEGSE